jgi:hypothetical protein
MSNNSSVVEHAAGTSSHSSDGEEDATKRHSAAIPEPLTDLLTNEYIAK